MGGGQPTRDLEGSPPFAIHAMFNSPQFNIFGQVVRGSRELTFAESPN